MELYFQEMTKDYALEILNWRYSPPYDLYNQEISAASIEELLTQSYKAIVNQNGHLIGFYCTGDSAQVPKGRESNAYEKACADIGLGMKPELTGQGLGKVLFASILEEVEAMRPLRLTVAKFNQRAIRLYETFDFKQVSTFVNKEIDFIVMLQDEKWG